MADRVNIGDWVSAYKGYALVERIIPVFYETWHEAIGMLPKDKKVGDIENTTVILKRICNWDFKTRGNIVRETNSIEFLESVTKDEKAKIDKVLSDEKVKKKFDALSPKSAPLGMVVNLDIRLPEDESDRVIESIDRLENNGNLEMTMSQVSTCFQEKFDVDIFRKCDAKGSDVKCKLQVYSFEHRYQNNEAVFTKIKIVSG